MNPRINPPLQSMVAPTQARSERRSLQPIDRLSRQLDRVCANAIDSLQVAAGLEAAGINDQIARRQYGFNNVFELAEELHRRVPFRGKITQEIRVERDATRVLRELGRGALFALPGAFYPAGLALLGASELTWGLMLALIAGWTWSQGMVRPAYMLLGRGHGLAAGRLLAQMMVLGIAVVAALAVAGAQVFGFGGLFVGLVAAQMAYQMALAVIMFYELDWRFWVAMVPALITNLGFVVLGDRVIPTEVALGFSGASVVLAVIVALRATRVNTIDPRSWFYRLQARDVRDTLWFVCLGALNATWLSFVAVRVWTVYGASPVLSLTITSLVLSMGALEWQLRRFRERTSVLLRETRSPLEFSACLWKAFVGTLGAYALVLTGLSVGFYALGRQFGSVNQTVVTMLGAYLVLGVCFFVAFTLMAQNRIRSTLACVLTVVIMFCAAVFGTQLVPLPPLSLELPVAYFASVVLLLVLLALTARTTLFSVEKYR